LGGVLKAVAKRALPFLAGAAGTFFGGPAGGALGATLGSAISKALELEYEALEQEDREFEMARSFVRLANDAARRAALTPPNIDPQIAVRDALLAAVRRLTPGVSLAGLGLGQGPLGGSAAGATRTARLNGGRWVRNGRTIVLIGA
jgi:hypothetical protein